MNRSLVVCFILSQMVSVAKAEEVKVGANFIGKKLKVNDTLVITDKCKPKDLPLKDPSVKIEVVGKDGKTMAGIKTNRFSVKNGNTTYYQTVIGDTSLEDFKNGKFQGTDWSGNGGCFSEQIFRLADLDEKCEALVESPKAGGTK